MPTFIQFDYSIYTLTACNMQYSNVYFLYSDAPVLFVNYNGYYIYEYVDNDDESYYYEYTEEDKQEMDDFFDMFPIFSLYTDSEGTSNTQYVASIWAQTYVFDATMQKKIWRIQRQPPKRTLKINPQQVIYEGFLQWSRKKMLLSLDYSSTQSGLEANGDEGEEADSSTGGLESFLQRFSLKVRSNVCFR